MSCAYRTTGLDHRNDSVREIRRQESSSRNRARRVLRGFDPEKKQYNPGYQVGTDFISNNRILGIDFTTIHLYPDQWVTGSDEEAKAAFVEKWIQAHIQDSNTVIQKPILLSEFGKSSKSAGYSVAMRDNYFQSIYNTVYTCARTGGPCGSGLFWQLLAPGMDNFRDGYEVVLEGCPSTASVIAQQSQKLSALES